MIDPASDHATFWWITLGLGVVVVSAVILLLQLLVTFVDDIDQGVEEAWNVAGGVATQTATTWMLVNTVTAVTAIRDETARHAALLAEAVEFAEAEAIEQARRGQTRQMVR